MELKALQDENSKLKRIYTDQALQITMLKDVIEKRLGPSAKGQVFGYLTDSYHITCSTNLVFDNQKFKSKVIIKPSKKSLGSTHLTLY